MLSNSPPRPFPGQSRRCTLPGYIASGLARTSHRAPGLGAPLSGLHARPPERSPSWSFLPRPPTSLHSALSQHLGRILIWAPSPQRAPRKPRLVRVALSAPARGCLASEPLRLLLRVSAVQCLFKIQKSLPWQRISVCYDSTMQKPSSSSQNQETPSTGKLLFQC